MTKALTIPLGEWDHLTSRAAIFASTDDTLPILAAVRVYESDGRLYAAATDRYRMAFVAAPESVTPPKGFDVLLSTRSLRDLARITKVPARVRSTVELTLDASKEAVTVSTSALPGLGEARFTLRQVDGDFPPITKLLRKALDNTADPAPGLALNPYFLADYSKVSRFSEPIRVQAHGPLEPVVIRVGGDFISLLQPNRFAGDERVDNVIWDSIATVDEKARVA